MTVTLPLPDTGRIRVQLEGAEPLALCGLAPWQRGRTALEWTKAALAAGDDAGANRVVRQAPLLGGVHRVGEPDLDGLPGFLADSLPDAWGRLLVDRQLRALGLRPSTLRGLDRLAIVGTRGPGALTYAPEVPLGDQAGSSILDLDALAQGAEAILRGDPAAVLDELQRAGGSAGGSRPKVWAALTADGALRSGAHTLNAGETGWLIKFRAPQYDPPDIAQLEFAYASMARAAGVNVAEPKLFATHSGHRYFGSRRFDREGPRRIHVLTAAGLLNTSASAATALDYSDLLGVVSQVTRDQADVLAAYRLAVFNVLAHNRDDHLKQFAFRRLDGRWQLAPAYDLTFSEGPAGEHTLLVAGEGRRPTHEHLAALATKRGLKRRPVRCIDDEVREAVARWADFADAAGVSETTTRQVQAHIDQML